MSFRLRIVPAVAAAAASLVFANAQAQTTPAPAAAPAPEPDYTLTANIGLFSQYVFRGVSQTNEKPAVQGGFDWSHKSGIYLGTWASNISWLSDATSGNPPGQTASASMEWDFYGGYKGSLPYDLGYDLGVLYYYYPGSYPSQGPSFPTGYTTPNTTELYAALSWKFLSFKYSYSAQEQTFGVPNSRGSQYLDLTASYDVFDKVSDVIGKVTVFGHLGKQYFKNSGALDYGDWKVGASAEFWGVTAGLYVTDTNANQALYTNVYGKKLADTQFVGYVQKTF